MAMQYPYYNGEEEEEDYYGFLPKQTAANVAPAQQPAGTSVVNLSNTPGQLPTGTVTPSPGAPAPPPAQPAAKTWEYQQFKNWNGGWKGGTPAQLKAWVESNPYAQGVTIGGANGDKLFFPGGGGVDAIIGAASGGTTYGWTQIGGTGGGAPKPVTPAPAATPTTAATPPANTALNKQRDELYDMLLKRATQPLAVDRTDPNFRQQTDAFAAAQERQRREYESAAAERLSAEGAGNSGAMDVERRIGMERAGQATGSFEAALIGREIQARRDEVATALESMRGMLTADQQNALQRELAQLDAAIKRQQIASNEALGYAGIDADLERAMLQNEQFNKSNERAWYDSWNQWDPRFRT